MRPLQFPFVPLELDPAITAVMAYVQVNLPMQETWEPESFFHDPEKFVPRNYSRLQRVGTIDRHGFVQHVAATHTDEGILVLSTYGERRSQPQVLAKYVHRPHNPTDYESLFPIKPGHAIPGRWNVGKNQKAMYWFERLGREFYLPNIFSDSRLDGFDGEKELSRNFPKLVVGALEANIDSAYSQYEHVPLVEIVSMPYSKVQVAGFRDASGRDNFMIYDNTIERVFPLFTSLKTDPEVSVEHQRKLLEIHLKRRAVSLGGQGVGHFVGTNMYYPVA